MKKNRKQRDRQTFNTAGLLPQKAPDTDGQTVALSAKVPPELKEWIQKYSAESGKSISQIVREALREYRDTVDGNF